MSGRVRILAATVLVLVGLACVIYAVASWRSTGRTPAARSVRPLPSRNDAERQRNDAAAREPPQLATPRRVAWLGVILVVSLACFFLLFILLLLRALRPRAMKRTGPSDTTDLWQEAGKRLKLE